MKNPIGRTENNKVKLRLKAFHRRVMAIGIVRSLLDCDAVLLPPINSGSGSGGNGEVKGSFTYLLEELKASGWRVNTLPREYKKTFQWTFNRSQLIGKLVIVGGIRYRIKEKAKKLERKYWY